MDTKIRKQIYLDPQQNEYLKRTSKESGLTEAEIIRQALNTQVQRLRVPARRLSAWERERQFLQKLLDLGPVPGMRTWKREDLYDR